MREREYHMKVRGIDHFCPAFIHPDLFVDSLTVWAVTVTTGIIVDLCMAAILTDTDAVSKRAGFTVHKSPGSFLLNPGLIVSFPAVAVIREQENLLYRIIRHDADLLAAGQKDLQSLLYKMQPVLRRCRWS